MLGVWGHCPHISLYNVACACFAILTNVGKCVVNSLHALIDAIKFVMVVAGVVGGYLPPLFCPPMSNRWATLYFSTLE